MKAAAATTAGLAAFVGSAIAYPDEEEEECPDASGEGEEHADLPGHDEDATGGENDPGGGAHDYDDGETGRPGTRWGHCKFDPDEDTDD